MGVIILFEIQSNIISSNTKKITTKVHNHVIFTHIGNRYTLHVDFNFLSPPSPLKKASAANQYTQVNLILVRFMPKRF